MNVPAKNCAGCGAALVRGHGVWVCAVARCPCYLDAAPGDAIVLDAAELARWRPNRRAERPPSKTAWWSR